MAFILGIETSCDETGIAVYDTDTKRITANAVFSQVDIHKAFGGVVPELASRSQLIKIGAVLREVLEHSSLALADIDVIGVTHTPGLAGSLLVGVSYAKGLAWSLQKQIIGINHLEGHIFSSFLGADGYVRDDIVFPFLCVSVSGGHSSLYVVHDFGSYTEIGCTIDDAAGEAFDKIAQLLGLPYPGGPYIEKAAARVDSQDFYRYPRHRTHDSLNLSFSGLKTAVLYDLVKKNAFDLTTHTILPGLTDELVCKVASSLQACIAEMFADRIARALKEHPALTGCAFVGGVSANVFISSRLRALVEARGKWYTSPPLEFCTDNGAMIAFVTGYKASQGLYDNVYDLDIVRHRR